MPNLKNDTFNFRVWFICDAYESGIGKGLKGNEVTVHLNPYATDTETNKDAYYAYNHGYQEGVKRRERTNNEQRAV